SSLAPLRTRINGGGDGFALSFLCIGLLFSGCNRQSPQSSAPSPASPAPSSRAASSVRMAERLEQLASKSDPAQNPFLNRQRAEGLQKRLTNGRPDPPAEFDLRMELALELLRAGDTSAATQELARIQEVLPRLPPQKREESAWLVARFTGQ